MCDVVADLVPFFGKMTNRLERKELGLILENAATLEPSLGFVAEICIELNAFDRKRVEEPDFERRMEVCPISLKWDSHIFFLRYSEKYEDW